MKAKLMLTISLLSCLLVFLPSCGESGKHSAAVSDSSSVAGLNNSTPISNANTSETDTTTAALPDTDAASKKDNTMTNSEQKTGSALASPSDKNSNSKAGAKIAENTQNKHIATEAKSTITNASPQAVANATGTNTGNGTTQTKASTANTSSPPDIDEPKPMYPKDPLPPKPQDLLTVFFSAANSFLQRNVANGLVNYNGIKSDKTELNALVQKIASADLSSTTDAEKQAFYINAYNILVIKQVIDNNLPKSPLDVSGFFEQTKHQVARKTLTLDQLEKTTLFGLKKDPRFHFVLVCAAKGCPPITNSAYLPETLDKQLTRQTQNAMNSNAFIKIDAKSKKVLVSKIFEWYKNDFTTGGKSVLAFINQYRTTAIPDNYKLDYYEYDWSLNRQ